ncbi:MAG TPA: DUF5715 family protein [Acidobacteriaceae bacterium]
MSRTQKNPLYRKAVSTVTLMLGLAMPALTTTVARAEHHPARHHAAAVEKTAAKPAARTKSPAAPAKHLRATAKNVALKSAPKEVAAKAAAPERVRGTRAAKQSRHELARKSAPVADKPTSADYEAAQRVHAWEAGQHTGAAPALAPATAPTAPHGQKATAADFIKASQPQSVNKPQAVASPSPAQKPVRSARGSRRRNVTATPPPLSSAVAKMLPGSRAETTDAQADAGAQVSVMLAPAMVPLLYDKRGRVIMPAAMRGSHDILVHQNVMADTEGLDRIQDDYDLNRKILNHQLVAIPVSNMLRVDERLPENRRYCRPWVAQFLSDMARAHYARFRTPLQVNSAVRTVEFQERLRRTNGNAAPSDGDTASPHLTGFAIDIGKKSLSPTEVAWMRGYLLPLQQQGKIDVEEEFQQACFHMSIYRKYLPNGPSNRRSEPAADGNILATRLQ